MARLSAAAALSLASLASIATAQEAFGGIPSLDGFNLDFGDMTPGHRTGLALAVMAGLLGGFVLGRLRRFGWDWRLAWQGPSHTKKDAKKPGHLKAGIEPVSDEDETDPEPEVDPASVRGSPAYQRKIRGKAITLLVLLCVGYYVHTFIHEK